VNQQANLIVRFLKISIVLSFIAHWIACMQYMAAYYQFSSTGKSWLSNLDIENADIALAYVSSLYYAFTTMCTVGYGDYSS